MATILIVDDRPINRQYLVTLLSHFGHQPLEAGDGIEALENLRTSSIDLVIADVLMPTMDGYDLLRRMRADPALDRTPVIFFTAAVYESSARAEAEALGVKHFLTKPAEPQLILSTVNAVLGLDFTPIVLSRLEKLRHCLHKPPSDSIDPNAVVFVVDDDSVTRKAMSMLMSEAGLKVETFSTAEAFLENYNTNNPGCLVLDHCLPGLSGRALLEILRSRRSHIPTIILTGHADATAAVGAMKLRALDFLQKPVVIPILLAKIFLALQADSIQRREDTVTESIRQRMALLTVRERALVEMLVNGKSSKEIADELKISVKTVSNHRANLMAKTHAENMADLVRMSLVTLDK